MYRRERSVSFMIILRPRFLQLISAESQNKGSLPRYGGLGGLFALGSALICTSGGLIQLGSQSAAGEFRTFEPFLFVGMLLLPVRDIFWTKASFGAVKVLKAMPVQTEKRPSFILSPCIATGGGFGVQATVVSGSWRKVFLKVRECFRI